MLHYAQKLVFFFGKLKSFKNVLISFTMPIRSSIRINNSRATWRIFIAFDTSFQLDITRENYMRFIVNLSGVISYIFIEDKNFWYKAEKPLFALI